MNSRRNPISYIGIICGIFLLFAAFFASNHAVYEQIGVGLFAYTRTTYPYSQYSFPLAIVGILSLIVGIIFLSQKTTEFSGSS